MYSHLRSKPLTFTPTFGGTIHGGGLWSSLKSAAKKFINSKQVKGLLRTGATKLLDKVPSLIEHGIQKFTPKLQAFETKNPLLTGLTGHVTTGIKDGSSKLLGIARGALAEKPKPAPPEQAEAINEPPPTSGTGRRPNYRMKSTMISASAFR